MKTFKQLLVKMPEYYLIALVFLCTFPKMIGLMGLGIIAILVLQIVYKNKISGIIIASLFILLNLFFLGAVGSEFNEFTVVNADAQILRAVGFSIFLFNSLMAGIMLFKYIRNDEDSQEVPVVG